MWFYAGAIKIKKGSDLLVMNGVFIAMSVLHKFIRLFKYQYSQI